MKTIPFWLVWNPDGRAPTYKHASQQSAEEEAKRLARLNPGKSFYVLMPVCEIEVRDIHIHRFATTGDDLPF